MKLLKICISTLILLVIFISCNSSDSNDAVYEIKSGETEVEINELLSEDEIADLLFLREEEKLARDVYLYAFDLYGTNIFSNIAKSEQQHMDSVLSILKKYGIKDTASEIAGEFNNPDLQLIYNSLIEKTNISLLEAFLVGNTVEDLDIHDIVKNEERTENSDLLTMYGLLKCGSRNHLRNFNKQVEQNEGVYKPIYITTEEFEAIISTSNEQCNAS